METIGEIIPFAKEVLNQRPKWGMVKIYTLGSTLAMLGVFGWWGADTCRCDAMNVSAKNGVCVFEFILNLNKRIFRLATDLGP
uniref:Uncharacterized protein n=1 Tax=Scophthalmus maximus TaxID=52904 RepID=A0A8D3BYI5_SCOMX